MGKRTGAGRFLADYNLKRFARWLRAAGYDVAWEDQPSPLSDVFLRARRESRTLITRNRKGPWYPGEPGMVIIEGEILKEQLVEFFRAVGSPPPDARFSRCTLCNEPLRSILIDEARPRLPRGVRSWCKEVWTCPTCSRLYWEGSHVDSMESLLNGAANEAMQVASDFGGSAGQSSPPTVWMSRRTEAARDWDRFDSFLRKLFARFHFSWQGFRKKRRSLRPRLLATMGELGLTSLGEYLTYLEAHPKALRALHEILSITVSRFFRDREEWIRLRRHLPELARGGVLRAWSVGCASGEEPYTLSILWKLWSEERRARKGGLDVLATDISSTCLERAHRRIYPEGAVHSAPPDALWAHFKRGESGRYELDRSIASAVKFKKLDLLADPMGDPLAEPWPEGPFDLILCRNLVFTYLDEPLRSDVARRLLDRLRPGGILMVGSNERPHGVSPKLRHIGGCLWRLAEGSTVGSTGELTGDSAGGSTEGSMRDPTEGPTEGSAPGPDEDSTERAAEGSTERAAEGSTDRPAGDPIDGTKEEGAQ